jgi:methionyl-tRNA formyltransferase
LRVLFLGTSAFACPALEILLSSSHEVVGVVSQPDRPKGRGQKLAPPPVKILAAKKNLPILQPEKIRDGSFIEVLRSFYAGMIVVVAYGQILSPAVLSLPPKGCINVHASLLPKFRGAAPIARAILAGETQTGVTTMILDSGMDTGPVLLQEKAPIAPEDNAGTLHDRLAVMGARLLLETLGALEKSEITPIPQDHSQATYAPKIIKEETRIRWDSPARQIFNCVRAFDPWPGAFTSWKGKILKLYRPSLEPESKEEPGTVIQTSVDGLRIATADGTLRIRELQLESRPRLSMAEFLKGYPLKPGVRLGE